MVDGDVRLGDAPVPRHHVAIVAPDAAPLDGLRTIWWNFVAHERARIEQAKADWRAGRFPAVPGESEFIPLPE